MLYFLIIPASATVININASGDTYICCDYLNVGNVFYMTVWHDNGNVVYALANYSISSIPAGAIINSATLYLYEKTGGNIGYQASIYNITSSWSETAVVWATRPTFDPIPFTYSDGLATAGWMSWNVTNTVKGWAGGSLANYGFLFNDTTSSSVMFEFCTKEGNSSYDCTGNQSYLSIDYTLPVYKKGDVNQDGSVNIADALFIAQYTVGTRILTTSQLVVADVDGDGQVKIVDALFIAQYTVGLRQL